MMVSLDSARQWYTREKLVACNADHSQIAKLKRGESSIYPSVSWAVKQAMLSAGDLYSKAKGQHHEGIADPSFSQNETRPSGPAAAQSRSQSKDSIDQ